jgi:hypothetical protein
MGVPLKEPFMTHPLFRLVASALGALAVCAVAATAQAAPVTARFAGTVTGYNFGFLDPAAVAFDNDNPVGTAVSWDLSFDDSFLGKPASETFGNYAATGSLQVGSRHIDLDGFSFLSLTLGADGTSVVDYRPQVNGTSAGPATSDGGDFFGMLLTWGPDLSLLEMPMVGYGYTYGVLTMYGYLATTGDYSLERGGSVPEPATVLLAAPALWWLGRRRRA